MVRTRAHNTLEALIRSIISESGVLRLATDTGAGTFKFGPYCWVDEATGHLGIFPGSTPHFYELFNLEDGNFLMQASGEVGWIMKRVGSFTLYNNPAFSVGRIFEDTGVTNEMEWRVMFYADGVSEVPLLEVESSGTIASIRRGALGSHWEGWYQNGDTYPLLRYSSYPRVGIEMGRAESSPGSAQTDAAVRRVAGSTPATASENMAGDACIPHHHYTTIVEKAVNYTVDELDGDKVMVNSGGARIDFTLPTCAAGKKFHFLCNAAAGLRVYANTADRVNVLGVQSGLAGYAALANVGDAVTFVGVDATNYVAIGGVNLTAITVV